jgi:hypothetical protein
MTGWDPTFLASAIKQCTSLSGLISDCPLFTINYQKTPESTCNYEAPAAAAVENCNGPLQSLCGNPGQKPPAPSAIVFPPPSTLARLVQTAPAALPQEAAVAPASEARGRVVLVTDWVESTVDYTVYVKRAASTKALIEPTPIPVLARYN